VAVEPKNYLFSISNILRNEKGFPVRLPETDTYEAPKLQVIGSVYDLTELQDKTFGATDGYTFMGVPIANASP
jgi:hypothetical protein